MKVSALLTLTRQTLRDTELPVLWSDAELVGFLAEAEEKAARNARLLRDSTTSAICTLTVVTTSQSQALDPRVIVVRRVLYGTRVVPLQKVSYHDLDRREAGWQGRVGVPDKWCMDFESGKLWWNRKPSANATANLFVVREPLVPIDTPALDLTTTSPEIPARYHRPLHHWACHRALSSDDPELADPDKAEIHRQKFLAEFGDDVNAVEEEWARQHYGEHDMEADL